MATKGGYDQGDRDFGVYAEGDGELRIESTTKEKARPLVCASHKEHDDGDVKDGHDEGR